MNKKGFSLIELMAVIVLLGIIITIASISIVNFRKDSTEKLVNEKIKYIETGALKWGEDNLNILGNICNYVNVYTFIAGGYITGDNDDKTVLNIPGTNESFNEKCVCVKYENIYANKDLDNYASSYNYINKTNYQVTATYGEGKCN